MLKVVIAIIVILLIVTVAYFLIKKFNKNIKVLENGNIQQYYEIQNIGNIEFENVYIETRDSMTYVNIDLVNNQDKNIARQEIIVPVKKDEEIIDFSYTIPDIKKNTTYTIQLMTTGDLSNTQQIEIKELDINL